MSTKPSRHATSAGEANKQLKPAAKATKDNNVCHTNDGLTIGVPYQRCTNAVVQQRIERFLYLPSHI